MNTQKLRRLTAMSLLTQEGCLERRARLWNRVDHSINWVLVADPRHVCYLSGFWVDPLSFSNGERSLLLLRRDGSSTLFADNFTRRSAICDPFVTNEVIEPWYDHKQTVINRDEALLAAFIKAKDKLAISGAVEGAALPLRLLPPEVTNIDLGLTLHELRRSKHADEISLLKRCMTAGEAGHSRALDVIRPGITEFQLYREVQDAAQEAAGCPCLVYGDFRANNAKTPKTGGPPTDYALRKGDLFILDFSVVIQGYRGDFTNTLSVGNPTAEQQRLFNACENAMRAAESQLKAGTEATAIYQAASHVLASNEFGSLAHHAGHGLGLAHPEPPILVPDSTDTLVAGDVITLEPGAYIPGVGGVRIERNYLITTSGYERLSRHKITLR